MHQCCISLQIEWIMNESDSAARVTASDTQCMLMVKATLMSGDDSYSALVFPRTRAKRWARWCATPYLGAFSPWFQGQKRGNVTALHFNGGVWSIVREFTEEFFGVFVGLVVLALANS